MSPALLGLVWAAIFAVPVSLLSRVRPRSRPQKPSRSAARAGAHSGPAQPARPANPSQQAKSVIVMPWKGAARLLAINSVLLFTVDSLAFYAGRPTMSFGGLVPLILVNLVLMV